MNRKNALFFWAMIVYLCTSCQGDINQSEKVVLDQILKEINFKNQETYALSYLNNIIEEGGQIAQNYYQRARIYLSLGEYQQAKKDIETAIYQSPNEGKYYFVLAQLFYKKGQYEKAYETIQKSEALGYRHPDQFTIDGIGKYIKGDKEKALKLLKLSEILHDSDSTTYLYLGRIYQEKGDTTQAMPLFRKVIYFPTLQAEAYGSMLQSYNQFNKPHKTLELAHGLEKEIMLASELLCVETAKAYQMIGLKDSAYLWYRRANALDPKEWETQKKLGEYFFDIQDIQKAGEIYLYATQTNTDKAWPFYRLAFIQEYYRNNLDSATFFLDQALLRDSINVEIQKAKKRIALKKEMK